MNRESFNPTLFVPAKGKSKFKTLEGDYVSPVNPGTIRETRDFIKKYDGVDGFKIYGFERFIYQYIADNYQQDHIEFDMSKINLVTIDIETKAEYGFPDVESAAEEMLLITIQDFNTKQIITWGVGPFVNKQKNVDYRQFSDEKAMLNGFIHWWIENTPDVVTGWNCEFFDLPYLAGRLARVLGDKMMKRLSPWGLVTQQEVFVMGRKNFCVDVGGVAILDYMRLYRWSPGTPNQESFRLDYIAQQELGQQKLDHSEFDTFKDFYTHGWQKFVEYNIVDVELVDRFEDKLKLIELALTMAYDAKVNYQDIFFQVRLWDCIIYNYLRKKNIVIPPKERSEKDEKYAGAYVKEPIPGKYDWVVSFDLNSLYPHLIMQYNISPETLIEERHPTATVDKILNEDLTFELYKDYAVCANGAMYRKDEQGFLPELMQKYYDERVIFKKKMIQAKKDNEKTPSIALQKEIARCNNIQMAKKISLNSAYGAIGNQYFRYYKLANAEAITLSGQVSIRWIENRMNGYLNKLLQTEEVDYVIASDTDSIYLNLGPLVTKFLGNKSDDKTAIVGLLDKICQDKLEPFIDKSYQDLADYVQAYDQKMFMKRENIADRGIWTAKKRYILNVHDSEGVRYAEPKLKIMGIEAVKSSTPAPCRQAIKDALKVVMKGTEDEAIDFIENFRKEFKSLPPEDISFPRSVSEVTKYKSNRAIYEKGTPIHVRGALLFNHHVKRLNLDSKYSLIKNGEKIKFCYLRSPNPIHENVMSFIQDFPRELGLEKYVDYDLQFEKSFLDPLKIILDVIGWGVEKTVNLESFFL
ncbi:DNA polymerase [Synechococcus phage S-CAM9]|uniref:DNA polymerase n=3 Tax=Caudoviricetes TaxID=2731619 RepID=A0A1D8KNY6_9CAUD|nr:DNA polymerase [Synechococcus phage S-CAM9]AOV60287.1 DNA polymerase [Synechococcus phage S-CAM9]AOV60515.1 DNA polymerase [Synechococcus phage S-CAM9]AOV60744.1 DNA polymerase [Synechococcus phage S-CAM9]